MRDLDEMIINKTTSKQFIKSMNSNQINILSDDGNKDNNSDDEFLTQQFNESKEEESKEEEYSVFIDKKKPIRLAESYFMKLKKRRFTN